MIVATAIVAVLAFAGLQAAQALPTHFFSSSAGTPENIVPNEAARASTQLVSEQQGSTTVPFSARVRRHEALPCTGPEEPINFEIFSAGPSIGGMRLTSATRRCDAGAVIEGGRSNEFTYTYGSCEPVAGEIGCQPPLAIQTWPACERSLADYSYNGKPIPYRALRKLGGAKVVEIELPFEHRIEVYTKSATVVIFAVDQKLAKKAVGLLRPGPAGEPPAVRARELGTKPANNLDPPSDEAVKGDLPCRT